MGERAELPEWLRQIAGEVHDLSRTSRNRAEFQRAIREVAERCCPMRSEDRPSTPSLFQEGDDVNTVFGRSTDVLRSGLTIAEKLFMLAVVRDHFFPTDRLDPFEWPQPEFFTIDESDSSVPQSEEDKTAFREMRFSLWYRCRFLDAVKPIARSGEPVVRGFLKVAIEHLDSLVRDPRGEIDDEPIAPVVTPDETMDATGEFDGVQKPAGRTAGAANPKTYLTTWPEILEAVDIEPERVIWFKALATRFEAPINFPKSRGKRPSCEKGALLDWWDKLEIMLTDQRNQVSGKDLETFNYGKDGVVTPEIGGSLKRKRTRTNPDQAE